MDNTVKDWEISALQAGYPMNRRVRRAATKKAMVYMNKVRRYAQKGSKRATSELAAILAAFDPESVAEELNPEWETLEELEEHALDQGDSEAGS